MIQINENILIGLFLMLDGFREGSLRGRGTTWTRLSSAMLADLHALDSVPSWTENCNQ